MNWIVFYDKHLRQWWVDKTNENPNGETVFNDYRLAAQTANDKNEYEKKKFITNGMGQKVAKRTGCVIECTAPSGRYPVGLYYPDGAGNYKCDTGQCISLDWCKREPDHFREVWYDHETGTSKPMHNDITIDTLKSALTNNIPVMVKTSGYKSGFFLGLIVGIITSVIIFILTL